MALPSNYVYDIRGAAKEDVQKVATAIAKAVNPSYNYVVSNDDMCCDVMHAYHPDYAGMKGVDFANDYLIHHYNDETVKCSFKSMYKVELLGLLTVAEAIKKFDL